MPVATKQASKFQSTPPARGATLRSWWRSRRCAYFNPRPPRGGRRRPRPRHGMSSSFQSTPPARGATLGNTPKVLSLYISIHAPREGGDWVYSLQGTWACNISIHAPREGGDEVLCKIPSTALYISIHAPREGGDDIDEGYDEDGLIFQSTPPARGATTRRTRRARRQTFQSTPPARGATQAHSPSWYYLSISIHAPREGGDSYRTRP